MTEADDQTLLRRYVENRSEDAFAEFVQRQLPLVYSAALRRTNGDVHRAQDVAQLVFTTLAREAAALTDHPSLAGWLHVATRNAATGLVRAEQRRRARENEALVMNEILASPEPAADWDRLRPVLDAALDELDERDREAVLLRFFHRQQFAAVAAALRVSEEAARKRVDRALERLRARLTRRGVTSTTGALALVLTSEAAIVVPAPAAAAITSAALAAAGLAAGAGGAAATTSLLTLMTTTKVLTGSAAAVAALAVATALYQTHAAQESAANAAALQSERSALTARVASLETRLRQADQARAAAVTTVAPSTPPGAPAAPLQHGGPIDHVLKHPETHAAFVDQLALRSFARHDRFIQSARLTAEQQEQLLKGLKEIAAADFDFMAALHSQGYGVGNLPNAEALKKLRAPIGEKREAFAADMQRLLGDATARQLFEFSRAAAERNVADQLAGRLYYTESVLTPQQADQLVQILGQSRLNPQAAGTPVSTMNGTAISRQSLNGALAQSIQTGGLSLLDWQAPISDAALAQAQAVLSAQQFTALKRLQAEQAAQLQIAPPPPPGFLGSK